MAYYLASRFDRYWRLTDMPPEKDPQTGRINYPQKLLDDMEYVRNNNSHNGQTADGGAWFIAKCLSVNGSEVYGPGENPVGKYVTVYYPTKSGTVVNQLKTVAAPCPPFCQDESG